MLRPPQAQSSSCKLKTATTFSGLTVMTAVMQCPLTMPLVMGWHSLTTGLEPDEQVPCTGNVSQSISVYFKMPRWWKGAFQHNWESSLVRGKYHSLDLAPQNISQWQVPHSPTEGTPPYTRTQLLSAQPKACICLLWDLFAFTWRPKGQKKLDQLSSGKLKHQAGDQRLMDVHLHNKSNRILNSGSVGRDYLVCLV